MDGVKYIDIMMNPIRQRILQTLMMHGDATTAQLGEALSDVPRASLYRHIKILLDADIITVTKEAPKRGTIEKTYAFKEIVPSDNSASEANRIAQNTLMHMSAEFAQYFSTEGCDPVKDMASLSSATLMLSDEEFMDFLQKLAQLIQEAMANEPAEGRKPRKIAFISIPIKDSGKE